MENNKRILPDKIFKVSLILIAIGAISVIAGFVIDKDRAMFNYLIMYMFVLSIGLGSLGLVGLEYLVGATWSTPFRRVSEFLSSIIPLLVLLVIPLFFGLHDLYHWTHKEAVEHDIILQSKEPYLNVPFFAIRVIVVLVIWILFFFLFTRNSQKQDLDGDPIHTRRNIILSTVFAPLFMVTITIAAIDFMMSLEPHWYSTIFGVYYFAGTILSALAALTFITIKLREKGYLNSRIGNDHFYSMGTMMFAFNIFWGYIGFSQLILIWYADIPEETMWYMMRWEGSWKYVSMALLFFHFVIPFLVLLPRSAKTNLKLLKVMSIWMLAVHFLDLYWLIMPTFNRSYPPFGWMELGFPLLGIGLLMLVFKLRADKINMTPVKDPKLESGLNFHL